MLVTRLLKLCFNIKRALCGLKIQTQIFNIYNIDEVKIQTQGYLFLNDWINKLFSEENKGGRVCQIFQDFMICVIL